MTDQTDNSEQQDIAGAADAAGIAPEAAAEAPATGPGPGPGDGAQAAPTVEEMEALKAENARLKDQALRAMAEAENTRRRFEREKQDATRYGIASFARDILDVADNLGRALEAAPAEQLEDHPLAKQLSVGVSMTEKALSDVLGRHGVTRIEPMGEKFDPNFHQAMFEVPDPTQPPGTVVQVVQAGYALHGRLLRPAMVGVAKGGETPDRVNTEA